MEFKVLETLADFNHIVLGTSGYQFWDASDLEIISKTRVWSETLRDEPKVHVRLEFVWLDQPCNSEVLNDLPNQKLEYYSKSIYGLLDLL